MSQNIEIDGLNESQEKGIVALLNHPTVTQAAKAVGVSERTMYRWMADRAFSRAYRKARREAFAQAIALTQRYAPAAVHTLAKIMADERAPHTSRVNAATAILRFSRESIELDDLAARVEALEEGLERDAPHLAA